MSDESWIAKRRLTEAQAQAISARLRTDHPDIAYRTEALSNDQYEIRVLRHRDGGRTNETLQRATQVAQDVLGYPPTKNEIGISHLYAMGEAKEKTR